MKPFFFEVWNIHGAGNNQSTFQRTHNRNMVELQTWRFRDTFLGIFIHTLAPQYTSGMKLPSTLSETVCKFQPPKKITQFSSFRIQRASLLLVFIVDIFTFCSVGSPNIVALQWAHTNTRTHTCHSHPQTNTYRTGENNSVPARLVFTSPWRVNFICSQYLLHFCPEFACFCRIRPKAETLFAGW